MASGRLVFTGRMPAIDADGVPFPDARMFFFVNRTTTLAVVYADEALTTPLTNPVLADSSGQFVPVWADQELLFSASLESIALGQIDTIDDLAPSNSVGGAANKLDRDGGNPEPNLLQNIGAAAAADIIPRVASIAALRAVEWPAARPDRVMLDTLIADLDGGGGFYWVSGSTAPDNGSTIIKEDATATGRWFRENAPLQGFREITLESLGAIGQGNPATASQDTAAFMAGAVLMQSGWAIRGQGNYTINETITLTTDLNPYWQEITGPRPGVFNVTGTVTSLHDGLAFDLYGNQGGANGPTVHIQSVVGPGKENVNSIGFRMEAGEIGLSFGECIGFYTPVLQNGCWSSTVTYSSIANCHTGILGQIGSNNGSSNNCVVNTGDHTGGPFMDARFPERRPLSATYGVDVNHMTGCHFDMGDVQYCQVEDDSIAVRSGPDTDSNTFRMYLEGSPPYPATGSLLHDSGRNNKFQLSGTMSPDNVIKAILLDGLGGTISGIGQRTGGVNDPASDPPTPVSTLSPDRGAGAVRIRPGNKWDALSSVHDHENMYAEAYNISDQSLNTYTAANCTFAAIALADLPDANNVQPGGRFTTANSAPSAAVSPAFTIAAKDFDRPIYVRTWVKLVTGPATVALYLQEDGENVAINKAWLSQGLDTVGQWQRMDLAAVIPAGQTSFRLRLSMRTVDDAQVDGCVIDWAFPIISWFPNPFSTSLLRPPSPLIIPGNVFVDPPRLTPFLSTVTSGGVLDCRYAPKVVVTATSSGIGGQSGFINLARGTTMVLNRTGADFLILAGGTIPVDIVIKQGCFVFVESDNAGVWVSN